MAGNLNYHYYNYVRLDFILFLLMLKLEVRVPAKCQWECQKEAADLSV